MSVWRREKTNASLRSSGVEQISNMHKEKPERLSDECSSPFCLVGMNELASRLLGTQMRAGEPLGSTIATNDAGERQDIESFFSETLRSGVASSVSRVHIIQPGAKSKDGADLRTRELSIDAFPLAAGCLGVSFKASHAEEIINDKVQAHPLSGAMASSSFAFCLAVRRENRETGNRGFVKREHITSSSSGIGWVFDYVSAGLSNALGCRTEELMGREVCSLCFQDGSDDSMQTLSAAMADGRECAVAVMLSRSTTSPTVRCRLWVSPLEGGQRYLLFYSQFRGVDSPGSASHILSFTEDEDVFCRIFESLTVGMILWRMESPLSSASKAKPRFRLLAANKKARSLNLSDGYTDIGRYLHELTPELIDTGLVEAYVDALASGKPRPLGLVPLFHEGYKQCLLASTAFPVSSSLLAIIFEEAPSNPDSSASPSSPSSAPAAPLPAPNTVFPSSSSAMKEVEVSSKILPSIPSSPMDHRGPTLPPLLPRKRSFTDSLNENERDTIHRAMNKHDLLTRQAHLRGHRELPECFQGASTAEATAHHHPFVRVPTAHKKQRCDGLPFGELPSPSALAKNMGVEWDWFRNSPVPFAVLDGNDDGKIVQANEAFGDLLGRPSEALVDTAFSAVAPGGARWLQALASRDGPSVHHGEALYRRRCGQGVECVESMWRLPGGRVGLLVQPIGALRERFPSALDDRIFQRCFVAAPFGVGLFGKEGRLLEANAAFTALLGHSESELIDQTFHAFIQPEDLEAVLSLPYRMVHSGLPSTQLIVRCRQKSGATLFCLMCLSLINDTSTGTTTHLVTYLQSMQALERVVDG